MHGWMVKTRGRRSAIWDAGSAGLAKVRTAMYNPGRLDPAVPSWPKASARDSCAGPVPATPCRQVLGDADWSAARWSRILAVRANCAVAATDS